MSRIGCMPIPLPDKVQVDIKGIQVTVTGPKGSLSREFHPDMEIVVEDGKVPGIDEEKLAENLQREQERIWNMLPSHDVFGRTIDEITVPSFKEWGEVSAARA